jgi:predicted DNA-binding transcriptional regulator AlpA
MAPSFRILRTSAVLELLGTSPATFYRRYRTNPEFPKPLDLPDGGLGYRSDEVEFFIISRGAGGNPRDAVFRREGRS